MPSTPSPDARVVLIVRLMDRSPVAYAVEADPMISGPLVPPCQCPRGGEYWRIGLVHAAQAALAAPTRRWTLADESADSGGPEDRGPWDP